MTTVKYFDVRDLFRAPRAGLSGKKIWVALNGLVLAYLGYAVFVYLSRMAIGMTFSGIWASQGLWPVPACANYTWPGWALLLIGTLFALVVLLLTASAVCRLAFEQFKGDDFYASRDAWAFSRRRWAAAILPPLGIIALLLFFLISGWLCGLIGRIPVAGELLVALAMPLAIVTALLTALLVLVFFLHFAIGPAVVGCTGGDTMDVLVQLFSCAWSQPWRLLLYVALLKGLTVLAVHVLVTFLVAGFWIIRAVIAPVMGGKLLEVFRIGYQFARFECPAVAAGCSWFEGCELTGGSAGCLGGLHRCLDLLFLSTPGAGGGAVAVAGYVFGVVLFLTMLTVAAYFFSTWFSGLTIIYLILRRRKDGEDLLQQEDDEEWEEDLEEFAETADDSAGDDAEPDQPDTRGDEPEG